MNIAEEVRRFVEEECKKPSNKYGYEIYSTHFESMVKNAKILAEKSNADEEIVELAAWLHDIGSVIYGRENHHITGAEIAELKLRGLGYDEEKIKKVKECILSHRGSKDLKPVTKEARIIADADGMAMFDRIEGAFMAAFIYEKQSQVEARQSVFKKMNESYNKLSPEAKKIIQDKYDASMLLLR